MSGRYSAVLETQRDLADAFGSKEGVEFLRQIMGGDDPTPEGYTPETAAYTVYEIATHGETYFWDEWTVPLLTGSIVDMPGWSLSTDLFPSPFGMFWFARPLPLTAPNALMVQNTVAFGWRIAIYDVDGSLLDVPMIEFVFFTTEQGWRLPMPFSIYACREGRILPDFLLAKSYADAGDQMRATRASEMLRYFGAALLFLKQNILTANPEPVERHVRKRLERAGAQVSPVHVVYLRREKNTATPLEAAAEVRAWSCQWVVRPHWRQQACGRGMRERRPRWILPYIKGDASKPLKAPASRIFAVVR